MTATILILMALIFTSHSAAFGQELSAEQKVRDFLSRAMGIEITTDIKESPCILYESVGLPYKIFTVDGCCKVLASLDGSVIYAFRPARLVFSEEDITGKTTEDAITDDEAFSSAVPILEYLGFSTEKSEYQIDFTDVFTMETEGDLYGSIWLIKKDMELNGVLCRTRKIRISASAASKTVIGFKYRPAIPPDNTLDNAITYTTARQLALDWLVEHPYLSQEVPPTLTGDVNNGTQVIAPNENRLESLGEETEPTKTYYCWEVPFTWVQYKDDVNGVVWVNVQTGEIVGADQVYE